MGNKKMRDKIKIVGLRPSLSCIAIYIFKQRIES